QLLFKSIKSIDKIEDHETIGKALLYLTDFEFDDDAAYETICILSYFFLSKDLQKQDYRSLNLINRVILLKVLSKKNFLNNFVATVLEIKKYSRFSPMAQLAGERIRDEIYKMEITAIEKLHSKGVNSLAFIESSRSE